MIPEFLIRAADAWIGRWKQEDSSVIANTSDRQPAVVVTGGSRGIGLALAQSFAKTHDNIVLIARDPTALERAASDLRRTAASARTFTLPLDLTTSNATTELENWLTSQNLYLDVLVNNAGIGLSGAFDSHENTSVENLIALNISSVTRLMHYTLPQMRKRGRGGILNVASLGGLVPGPYQAAYYASKAYVISLTEAVASENAGLGVRVCALAPGPVNTAFHEAMDAQASFYRQLLPALSPQRTARAGHSGFLLGRKLVIPGIFNTLLALSVRLLPHGITVPITRWLLAPRKTT